jgi:uncharacterized repeat protein (TIGR03803 family)
MRLAWLARVSSAVGVCAVFGLPATLQAAPSPYWHDAFLRFPTHVPKRVALPFDSARPLRADALLRAGTAALRWSTAALRWSTAAPRPSTAASPTLNALYDFKGGSDGTNAQGGLVAFNGLLYGTTNLGGVYGHGSVFVVTPSGSEHVLHSFTGGTDGGYPLTALVAVGNELYGTTYEGGTYGAGTVFDINASGTGHVLYEFKGGTADGANPHGRLLNVSGKLYGTTRYGGANGLGTIYTISTAGAEAVAYSFKGGIDGAYPASGLIDVNGMLYGTTESGGNGDGTVFRVSKAGAEHVIHAFAGGDGDDPWSNLIAVSGTLYGTTQHAERHAVRYDEHRRSRQRGYDFHDNGVWDRARSLQLPRRSRRHVSSRRSHRR